MKRTKEISSLLLAFIVILLLSVELKAEETECTMAVEVETENERTILKNGWDKRC